MEIASKRSAGVSMAKVLNMSLAVTLRTGLLRIMLKSKLSIDPFKTNVLLDVARFFRFRGGPAGYLQPFIYVIGQQALASLL